MKKDYAILAVFLAIVLISGGSIYVFHSSRPPGQQTSQTTAGSPDQNRQLRAQVNRMEGQLTANPNDLGLLVDLGNAYYDLNEPKKSIEYYERALAIRPASPGVLVDCGAMYREAGNADKAIELFKKAIQIDPSFPQAYFNLGAVLRMEKGDREGAAVAWKKYLELAHDVDPQLRELLENEIKSASESQG